MPKVQVYFAPSTEVALVTTEGVTVPPCWAVSPKWGVRDEWAPHMFNAHHDPAGAAVEMEDLHPFPNVLAELERRMKEVADASEEAH